MSVMRNSPLVRWVGLLLICFGALLFGLEKAMEWVNGQHFSPVVLIGVPLGALGVLVWWLRRRNHNRNEPNAKGSREIKIHFSRGVQKALVLTFVVAVFWEIGYRYMRQSYAGTNVEISRFGGFNQAVQQAFPATTHLLGADRPKAANQQSHNEPAVQNELACTERNVNWTRDNIHLTNEAGGVLIVETSRDYIVRPGDVVTICAEASNLEDLHKIYLQVGGDRIVGSDQTTWRPDSTARRIWYSQMILGSFDPEVDGTGGYLHFLTKQYLTNPVRIFVRFR